MIATGGTSPSGGETGAEYRSIFRGFAREESVAKCGAESASVFRRKTGVVFMPYLHGSDERNMPFLRSRNGIFRVGTEGVADDDGRGKRVSR